MLFMTAADAEPPPVGPSHDADAAEADLEKMQADYERFQREGPPREWSIRLAIPMASARGGGGSGQVQQLYEPPDKRYALITLFDNIA